MPCPIVIVSGPTACGKTELVHGLADPQHDYIINCDSRQFFSGLNIGTAKPISSELKHYRYRLVDFLSPGESFSAYDFLQKCIDQVETIHKEYPNKSKIFLVGGSLFYIEVLKRGLPSFPPISPEIKNRIQRLWEDRGLAYLTEILKEKDPDCYHEIDLMNPRRVIRALEIVESGGQASKLRQNRQPPPWDFLEITPILPRQILYQKIEDRVNEMMDKGWIDEVRGLLKHYPAEAIKGCSAIGYSEIIDYLTQKSGYQETVSLIQQRTRRMAKSQITWVKKDATGFLIFNPKTCYNKNGLFDQETLLFSDPVDLWMNRYPRVSPGSGSSEIPDHLPSLLVSKNPVKDIMDRIG